MDSRRREFTEDIRSNLRSFIGEHCAVDIKRWRTHNASRTAPQQENGYDCGVFLCTYAECISRDELNFSFSQVHMPYFRQKISYELLVNRHRMVIRSAY